MTELLELWQAGQPAKAIARALGVEQRDVYRQARMAGIRRTQRWSPEEDAIVVRYYGKAPADVIVTLLPGRTAGSVWARYWRLNNG